MTNKYAAIALGYLLLVGCQGQNAVSNAPGSHPEGGSLDRAAERAGLIAPPDTLDLEGSFERRSDLGVDRFCAISAGIDYRIGLEVAFGANAWCWGQGSARLDDGEIHISLETDQGANCAMIAQYDGVRITLPGKVPVECDTLCTPRASFAGIALDLLEPGAEAAAAVIGRKQEPLCPRI